jgi:hypothetical protein
VCEHGEDLVVDEEKIKTGKKFRYLGVIFSDISGSSEDKAFDAAYPRRPKL